MKLTILHRYLLQHFLMAVFGSLLIFTSLFIVFDFFEQIRLFMREGASIGLAGAYLLLKVPLVVQLMMPMAILIGTLISVGKMSQLSEITAMRACGISVNWIARPLILTGVILSFVMMLASETVVPWATRAMDEIYQIDIKKKVEKGKYSRDNFWYRDENKFYNIGYYDSRNAQLSTLSVFELGNNFELKKRIDATDAEWVSPLVGWDMKNVVEMSFNSEGGVSQTTFRKVPLVISETPSDFYNMQLSPESLNYVGLKRYIEKLKLDGVPVTAYQVDLAAKLAFPFVNALAVLIAFPFALTPARSGKMTKSFIAGISVGFGYHLVHAVSLSLGAGELIPIVVAAWAGNVLFASLGVYLLSGAEHAGT